MAVLGTDGSGNGRQGTAVGGGVASAFHRVTLFDSSALLGLAAASTAITAMAAWESAVPPGIHKTAYLLALSGAFFAGVTQVAASVWAAGGQRLAAGRKLVLASFVAPLAVAAGLTLLQ